jgi:hypothetical protein
MLKLFPIMLSILHVIGTNINTNIFTGTKTKQGSNVKSDIFFQGLNKNY